MIAYLLANGNLVVPFRAETDGMVGDMLDVIAPTHPDHERWLAFAIPAPDSIEAKFGNQKPRAQEADDA